MSAILSLPPYADEHLARLDPAELIDLLIADEDRVPRNLIDECMRRGEAMAERLGALPDDNRYWTGTTTRGEWWLLLHAVMILGLMPGERAGALLVDFMRRMSQADDDSLQDWLAGYWPALFLNKPASVQSPLPALCTDRRLDWYIRANALDAAVASAQQQGGEHLEQALTELAALAADEEEDWELRLSAGNVLLDFPRTHYRPLLEGLAARQGYLGAHFSQNDIERAYLEAEDKPEWTRFKDPWAFYAPAAIENRRRRWQKEDADHDDDEWDDIDLFLDAAPLPYIRPLPKTGRNDPCPCGSGKKYKKCCLPASAKVVGDSRVTGRFRASTASVEAPVPILSKDPSYNALRARFMFGILFSFHTYFENNERRCFRQHQFRHPLLRQWEEPGRGLLS